MQRLDRRWFHALVVLLLVVAVGAGGMWPASYVAAAPPSNLPADQLVYFSQTGHHLGDRSHFLSYWRTHGGILVFGYPISEELVEDGRTVQYFERARFEHHPEHPDPEFQVQLSLLGSELTRGRDFEKAPPDSGERFFPETGQSISGPFHDFWRKRGGLKVFGHPISKPLEEISAVDGRPYTVQYFERARFEHHPEDMGPFYRRWAQDYNLRLLTLYEVRLGDLGRQAAQRSGRIFDRVPRQDGVPEWSPQLWKRRIEVNLSSQWLTAYEDATPVFRAPVATGRDGFDTPTGSFRIYDRYQKQTMFGASGWESWYVTDVPWVQYIVGGVALHGTYWHDQWGTGTRMSHGCINLSIDDAEWLYAWAGLGTEVNVSY
jgi:lipoprotein-anchoring transpeptidase ErfK/SrfK